MSLGELTSLLPPFTASHPASINASPRPDAIKRMPTSSAMAPPDRISIRIQSTPPNEHQGGSEGGCGRAGREVGSLPPLSSRAEFVGRDHKPSPQRLTHPPCYR